MTTQSIPEKILIKAQIGSHAYGTSTPTSDTDFMEVVAASDSVYLSLDWFGSQGTKEKKETDAAGNLLSEETSYELTKFMRLCQNFNPNVIPLLYVSRYEHIDPLGQVLIDNRKLFTSLKAVDSFAGYAYRQLQKMGENNPATGKMGAKRKQLRDQFGFDVKYMYHAVRLARMIVEFLNCNGENLIVDRTSVDAQELLDIRNGLWSYEKGQKEILRLLDVAKTLALVSNIPAEPDKQGIRDLARYILRQHLGIN